MFLCFNIFKKPEPTATIPVPTQTLVPNPSPTPSNIATSIWSNLSPINLDKIRNYAFPETKYFHDEYAKTQIVLHHTISGYGIDGDISTWINGKYNIGTTIIIDRSGVPWQIFPSKYWAYHLGAGNHSLDKHSIGIEIDNWGGLVLGDGTTKQFGKNEDGTPRMIHTVTGKYYAYYGNAVDLPNQQIQNYSNGFRGYQYFEKYTIEQIRTVGQLLLYWKNKYNIPLYQNPTMFNYSQEAMNGKPGIWTHTSYRTDKSDIHPQPEMVEMLNYISTDPIPVSFKKSRRIFIPDRRKNREVS